jgi:dUTP pyrophosphatase
MPRHPLSCSIRIKKLHEEAQIPQFQSEDASGMDLYACLPDGNVGISPGEARLIPCGIAVQIDQGYEGTIRPRSGLAVKYLVTVLNSPGTLDSDYRGEVKVILINHGNTTFIVADGERIAQLVLQPVPRVSVTVLEEGEELDNTARGEGGFGSTGSS